MKLTSCSSCISFILIFAPTVFASGPCSFREAHHQGRMQWKNSLLFVEGTMANRNNKAKKMVIQRNSVPTRYPPGSKMLLRCVSGFTVVHGTDHTTCLRSGKWSNKLGDCQGKPIVVAIISVR